jgi:hypothetical protein
MQSSTTHAPTLLLGTAVACIRLVYVTVRLAVVLHSFAAFDSVLRNGL